MRVIPRAGVTKFAGVRDNRLVIRLAAPPVDGAANDALISFLSKVLDIPSRQIEIVSGAQSRNKNVALSGMTAEEAERRLKELL